MTAATTERPRARRIPGPRQMGESIRILREKRADPDPGEDKRIFDQRWSKNGQLRPLSPQFRDGTEKHHRIIAKQLEFDLNARMRALNAATSEAANYLNTFALFLVAAGLLLQTEIDKFIHSPYSLSVWLPTMALVLLLRSHASRLSSIFDNFEGAGAYASQIQTEYAFVNNMREYLLRRNADMQRAKRRLAMVCLLYTISILMVSGYITFMAIRAIISAIG